LRCNCTFALVFLTLHVCPWFSKLKAPFAPVCQHRELDLNNCSKIISQKRKKGEKTTLPLIPNTLLPSPSGSPTRESPPAYRRTGLRPPPPHGPEPPPRAPCPPPPRRSPPPARRRSARRRPPPRPHAINAAKLTGRPPLPRPPPPTSPRPINRPPPHLRPSTSSPTAASAPAQPRSAASASRRSLPSPGHLAASPPEVRARVEPPPPPQARPPPLAPSPTLQRRHQGRRRRTNPYRPPPPKLREGINSPWPPIHFPLAPAAAAPWAAGEGRRRRPAPLLCCTGERRKKGKIAQLPLLFPSFI